jgi:hypothetical protein
MLRECSPVVLQIRTPRIRFSIQQPSASLTPFDGAESDASEKLVNSAHRLLIL